MLYNHLINEDISLIGGTLSVEFMTSGLVHYDNTPVLSLCTQHGGTSVLYVSYTPHTQHGCIRGQIYYWPSKIQPVHRSLGFNITVNRNYNSAKGDESIMLQIAH